MSSTNLDDVVRLLGHEGELHHGGGQFLHGHGGLALHQDAAPRGCVHVVVLVLELLLGLVHLGRGGGHLLKDLLEVGLKLLHFFASVPDLNVKLVTDGIALTDVLFVLGILLVQSVNVELKERMFNLFLNSLQFPGFFLFHLSVFVVEGFSYFCFVFHLHALHLLSDGVHLGSLF